MSSSLEEPFFRRRGAALETLLADLAIVFGNRLRSVVAYDLREPVGDGDLRTLVLVETLTADDLHRLARTIRTWRRLGLAVPLILTAHEFARTLDVFPLEYGNIIDSHVLVNGPDPFQGVEVPESDRRRGCELAAKSHLIHLREGFLEAEGDAKRVANLIARSAPAFRALLVNIVRLDKGPGAGTRHDDHDLGSASEAITGVPRTLVAEVLSSAAGLSAAADPSALLARYIEASERIWRYVDGWRL
jgi:hypothetical protein